MKCPYCTKDIGEPLDFAPPELEEIRPGDASFCPLCDATMILGEDMRFRKVTPQEKERIDRSPEMILSRFIIKMIRADANRRNN